MSHAHSLYYSRYTACATVENVFGYGQTECQCQDTPLETCAAVDQTLINVRIIVTIRDAYVAGRGYVLCVESCGCYPLECFHMVLFIGTF